MTIRLCAPPPRTPLPNRRDCVVEDVKHITASGHELTLPVTFGFDADGRIREFFCTPAKSGTDIQALINDGALMASILLQHGVSISELAAALGENRGEGEKSGAPSSAFGAIARAGVLIEQSEVKR